MTKSEMSSENDNFAQFPSRADDSYQAGRRYSDSTCHTSTCSSYANDGTTTTLRDNRLLYQALFSNDAIMKKKEGSSVDVGNTDPHWDTSQLTQEDPPLELSSLVSWNSRLEIPSLAMLGTSPSSTDFLFSSMSQQNLSLSSALESSVSDNVMNKNLSDLIHSQNSLQDVCPTSQGHSAQLSKCETSPQIGLTSKSDDRCQRTRKDVTESSNLVSQRRSSQFGNPSSSSSAAMLKSVEGFSSPGMTDMDSHACSVSMDSSRRAVGERSHFAGSSDQRSADLRPSQASTSSSPHLAASLKRMKQCVSLNDPCFAAAVMEHYSEKFKQSRKHSLKGDGKHHKDPKQTRTSKSDCGNSSIDIRVSGHANMKLPLLSSCSSTPPLSSSVATSQIPHTLTRTTASIVPTRTKFNTVTDRKHRYNQTATALEQSGLMQTTMKTAELLKKNGKLQKEIHQLRHDTQLFMQSLLENPQNQPFRQYFERNRLSNIAGKQEKPHTVTQMYSSHDENS